MDSIMFILENTEPMYVIIAAALFVSLIVASLKKAIKTVCVIAVVFAIVCYIGKPDITMQEIIDAGKENIETAMDTVDDSRVVDKANDAIMNAVNKALNE